MDGSGLRIHLETTNKPEQTLLDENWNEPRLRSPLKKKRKKHQSDGLSRAPSISHSLHLSHRLRKPRAPFFGGMSFLRVLQTFKTARSFLVLKGLCLFDRGDRAPWPFRRRLFAEAASGDDLSRAAAFFSFRFGGEELFLGRSNPWNLTGSPDGKDQEEVSPESRKKATTAVEARGLSTDIWGRHRHEWVICVPPSPRLPSEDGRICCVYCVANITTKMCVHVTVVFKGRSLTHVKLAIGASGPLCLSRSALVYIILVCVCVSFFSVLCFFPFRKPNRKTTFFDFGLGGGLQKGHTQAASGIVEIWSLSIRGRKRCVLC